MLTPSALGERSEGGWGGSAEPSEKSAMVSRLKRVVASARR